MRVILTLINHFLYNKCVHFTIEFIFQGLHYVCLFDNFSYSSDSVINDSKYKQ